MEGHGDCKGEMHASLRDSGHLRKLYMKEGGSCEVLKKLEARSSTSLAEVGFSFHEESRL